MLLSDTTRSKTLGSPAGDCVEHADSDADQKRQSGHDGNFSPSGADAGRDKAVPKTRDVSPTHSEMRALLGTGTKSQISPLLQALSQKSWLKILPGVERGCVPLREGVPLYDAERLRPVETNMTLREEEPPEPIWVDCPALWESCFGKLPDLCLRMQGDAVEGRDILALGRRRDAAGNVTIADGDQVAVRIEEDIVLATARVLNENTVELRWGSAEGKTPTIRMTEESDAAEIIGTVMGRLLPGPG